MAAGIRAGFGTMTKPLHVGRAAENGVTAALLVRNGFTANEEALDGKWGYLAVAGPGAEPALVRERFGKPFTMLSPGISIKPYPSGVLTHPSRLEEHTSELQSLMRISYSVFCLKQ